MKRNLSKCARVDNLYPFLFFENIHSFLSSIFVDIKDFNSWSIFSILVFEHHEICANNKKENNDAFQKLLYMRHMLIVSFRSHLCSVCALFSLNVQYSRSYEHRSQTVNVPFVQQSFTLYTAIIYTTHSPSSQYLHTIYSPMLYMYLCLKLIYSLNHHLRIACSSFVHMQVGLFLDFRPSFIWVPQFIVKS